MLRMEEDLACNNIRSPRILNEEVNEPPVTSIKIRSKRSRRLRGNDPSKTSRVKLQFTGRTEAQDINLFSSVSEDSHTNLDKS